MDDGRSRGNRPSSNVTRMLPTPILDLLQAAFPGQPIGDPAPTSGGFSNLTAIVTIGPERCVVKASSAALKRDDVRREAQVLRLLRRSDLPIPTVLAAIEDRTWTLAVTRFVAGEHGLA